MSAPPPRLPNGGGGGNVEKPNAPKGRPPFRRSRPTNPLVTRKGPDPTKMMNRPASTRKVPDPATARAAKSAEEIIREKDRIKLANFEAQRKKNSGWTDPPPEGCDEYPLTISKRALKEGMRFHIMRFAKAKGGAVDGTVDPTNPDEFIRPVTLHRRDPRQPAPGREVKVENEVKEETPAPPNPEDEKEAERLAQLKAEKEAQRAIDLAQIAPSAPKSGEPPAPKKTNQKKEKPFNAHFKTNRDNPKAAELRYEEALPWHLEDADGRNVWVGSYVAALSEANVGLVVGGAGFKAIPLEKYYRFISKPRFKAFTLDQAESHMRASVEIGRWAMKDKEKEKEKDELEATRQMFGGRTKVKKESSTYRQAPRSEKLDRDEFDMSGDEFQDDDENPGMEPENDDEAKESRERIRRNHLGANLFGEADEREVEKEEAEALLEDMKRKQEGKKVRKALARREKHLEYQSDSDDDNPYAESSSDEEAVSESEKKEQEAKEKEKEKEKEKLAAGTTTAKGSTTPQSKQKLAENAKAAKSLKRAGSPNLSESSGNESMRKKAKKTATGSAQPSRSGTPMPGQQQKAKSRVGAGAASDGEATGGEMSDSGRKTKPSKLANAASATGAKATPVGSRAGSPVPSQPAVAPASNPGSPARSGPANPPPPSAARVTSPEVIAALEANPNGISIGDLLRRYFSKRVGKKEGQMSQNEWVKIVMKHGVYKDKLIWPKPKNPNAAA